MDWRDGMWSQQLLVVEWVQWWREESHRGACAGFSLTWKIKGVVLFIERENVEGQADWGQRKMMFPILDSTKLDSHHSLPYTSSPLNFAYNASISLLFTLPHSLVEILSICQDALQILPPPWSHSHSLNQWWPLLPLALSLELSFLDSTCTEVL